MKLMRILILCAAVGLVAAGCSQDTTPTAPGTVAGAEKNGTETLGPPSIAIATGSGVAQGGVGMQGVGDGTAMLDIDVPAGATVKQVLAYWSGGTTSANGDDAIVIDGNDVTGELIGGPTLFYGNYNFYAYRADITGLGLVGAGSNSLEISGMNFVFDPYDENNGVSVLAIYDDGTSAEISLVDGLDMAFFQFSPTLNATVPQTFNFAPEPVARTAEMVVFAGSVEAGRPNSIVATTVAGPQTFTDPLGSTDGPWWDSITLQVDIPAGADFLTVQLFSTPQTDPLGASMSWVGSSLSVPVTPLACIGDFVWHDMNMDGIQDEGEPGVPGITVHLMDCQGNILAETMTDVDGKYSFCELEPGDYNIHFVLPAGWVRSPMDQGGDDALDSDADPSTGLTICTTLDPGENDWTWDAGIYEMPAEGCSHTIGYWKTHAGLGPQDDVVTPLLPQWLGDAGGAKSIQVTTPVMVVELMTFNDGTYGNASNGITKLYAQLLGVKLSIADGASGAAVADEIADADAFLAMYSWEDWSSLTRDQKNMVNAWMTMFDDYNNGDIGPGHCDETYERMDTADWNSLQVNY